MKRKLHRCVALKSYEQGTPPSFLFTSGRRNRWNTRGVQALYFSESESTALLEWEKYWRGKLGQYQPKVFFSAEVAFRKIFDLHRADVRSALGMDDTEIFANWRVATSPTMSQRIGESISRQTEIAAVRFPSDAAREEGQDGWNVVIFPSALRAPDRVAILGYGPDPLQTLP